MIPWEHGGDTALHHAVMLCRVRHRLVHHSEWVVRIRAGLPEFIPPRWIASINAPAENPCRT